MKYMIILGDGMADRPIKSRENKTPLQLANIPSIDKLCSIGRTGQLVTVPPDMPPGSEVANLAVLGYDVYKVYQGRGVLEGASMGVTIEEGDLAMRCNLLCLEDDKIKNHSAGHITTSESHLLIDALNEELSNDQIRFYKGISFRHLLVIKGGNNDLKFTPPHDVPGTPWRDVLIEPTSDDGIETAKILNDLIIKSQDVLRNHPVNLKRRKEGKDPANSAWFWSSGYKPAMKTLQEKYNIKGAAISAVDIIKGLGIYAGMDVIEVEGATGLIDTNYEGKAEAAINALKDHDFVYLHVEATDEAGHEGNIDKKIKALEYLDSRLVKYIMEQAADMDEPVSIGLIPDHATPCEIRTHTHDAVPFVIYNPTLKADEVTEYNEFSVKKGFYGVLKGDEFIKTLLGLL
ncbi:MAG: cofactor-independent phosphoglycerate mutase [Candidatus Stygibacter australis]|nr:cofactor-independent phosphoglycerate mutase [Candidatus Stygibacter australis]MDP8321562.1 cofactor-independent phosphoglycerate mutase [Candidatus Stygibacter australis]